MNPEQATSASNYKSGSGEIEAIRFRGHKLRCSLSLENKDEIPDENHDLPLGSWLLVSRHFWAQ